MLAMVGVEEARGCTGVWGWAERTCEVEWNWKPLERRAESMSG